MTFTKAKKHSAWRRDPFTKALLIERGKELDKGYRSRLQELHYIFSRYPILLPPGSQKIILLRISLSPTGVCAGGHHNVGIYTLEY